MIVSPLLRVIGRDAPLDEVLVRAQRRALPVAIARIPDDDYALIDPALAIETIEDADLIWTRNAPAPGLSYAGFAPQQRGAFLTWQRTPLAPAPLACQQIYLANLEVRLLENEQQAQAARIQLQRMQTSTVWANNPATWRVALFAAWLAQAGSEFAVLATSSHLPADLLGLVIGLQGLLATPLAANQLLPAAQAWSLPSTAVAEAVLTFRVQSLADALGAEPLQHLLARHDEGGRRPQPWRCQHRGIRLHFPQPDLQRDLEPLLRELLVSIDGGAQEQNEALAGDDELSSVNELSKAHMIVEFRQSRSEYFSFALKQAQKQNGFAQLLDEDRHLVYRVPFRKSEMRRFWQLWNYVQSWTSTRVYCQGRELHKSQVYPYSQFLR